VITFPVENNVETTEAIPSKSKRTSEERAAKKLQKWRKQLLKKHLSCEKVTSSSYKFAIIIKGDTPCLVVGARHEAGEDQVDVKPILVVNKGEPNELFVFGSPESVSVRVQDLKDATQKRKDQVQEAIKHKAQQDKIAKEAAREAKMLESRRNKDNFVRPDKISHVLNSQRNHNGMCGAGNVNG